MQRHTSLLVRFLVLALFLGFGALLSGRAQAETCSRVSMSVSDPNTGQSWSAVSKCHNDGGAAMYLGANYSTPVANMDSTYSWFVCYAYGEQHSGGNNVWYYSQGDRGSHGAWGYMPAANVWTTSDPGSSNLPQCAPDMWQTKLSVYDPNTGTTWPTVWVAGNDGTTPLYRDATYNSPIVGSMDTTQSWFTCYAHGAVHEGNNDVWYYTQGDHSTDSVHQAWGFMPAYHVHTRSDPYDAIPQCGFGNTGGSGNDGGTVLASAPIQCGSGCVEPPALTKIKAQMSTMGISFSGICGDANHTYGYHLPANSLPSSDYSMQGSLNSPVCGTYASAIDIGMNFSDSRRWLKWLLSERAAGRLTNISEIIGSVDGVIPLYYSDNDGGWVTGRAYNDTSTHVTWSHVAIWRSKALDTSLNILSGILPVEGGDSLRTCSNMTLWNVPSAKVPDVIAYLNTGPIAMSNFHVADVSSQRWSVEWASYLPNSNIGASSYRIVAPYTSDTGKRMCLDASTPNAGSPVYIYECTDGDNQKWYSDGKKLRNALGDKCLETTAGSLAEINDPNTLTTLRLADCRDGEWDQSWTPQCNY